MEKDFSMHEIKSLENPFRFVSQLGESMHIWEDMSRKLFEIRRNEPFYNTINHNTILQLRNNVKLLDTYLSAHRTVYGVYQTLSNITVI